MRAFVIEALTHTPVDLFSIVNEAIAAGFPETLVDGVFIAGVLAFDPSSLPDVPAYAASRGDLFQRETLGGDDIHFFAVPREAR